ncbi:hypothetical protein C8R46DRAFT_943223, partial [Mycena filopes]
MSLLRSLWRQSSMTRGPRAPRNWSSIAKTPDGQGIVIDALGGASFPFIWLRDSCPSTIHPSTSQKLRRTSDIPPDVRPAANNDSLRLTDAGLHIDWADGHASFFSRDFLRLHSSPTHLAAFHGTPPERLWGRAEISANPNLFVPYASLQGDTGLRAAIDQLCADGLLFVTGVPHEETADATCELRALAGMFSHIRETFYGQVWDVVNLRESRNIAYTNLDLGFHMDLLYFKHPPKYQILHCLRNRVRGGASLFADAFRTAETLRTQSPADFAALANIEVPFHYVNDGHHLFHAHPTIELASSPSSSIAQINYSPPFQAPLHLDTPPQFYGALRRFAALLDDPARESVFEYQLREGDAVIFDNRRVLHARTAFSDIEGGKEDGEPNRWLKGCYFEADGLLDRGRMLGKRAA